MEDARIEWTVLCDDGEEVTVYANDPKGAIMEAVERGYFALEAEVAE